jgi:peptide/nickel transport system ATP-binding protein
VEQIFDPGLRGAKFVCSFVENHLRNGFGVLTANEILEWDMEGTPAPAKPLLVVDGLVKHFPVRTGLFGLASDSVRAVDGLSFTVYEGETLGIVGESGCGKSTAARLLMHLATPTSGTIELGGRVVGSPLLPLKSYRGQVQMVFQDASAALNPCLTIENSIAFGPIVHGVPRGEAMARARALLDRVGLASAHFADLYPHELSGDQRQRVNIARSLALRSKVLILDEAVSALDKSIAARILNLLLDLKDEFGLTYIFISRDLEVVRFMSDRVMVMHRGKIAEIGTTEAVYNYGRHPHTQALLDSMLPMDPDRRTAQAPLSGAP